MNERYLLDIVNGVDQVIKCPPWVIDQEFIDKYNIHLVAHDDLSYPTGSPNDVHRFVKENGYFLTTTRSKDISTSELITRIIKNYDVYLDRNLKRGVDEKDLNISKTKKLELKIKSFFRKYIGIKTKNK